MSEADEIISQNYSRIRERMTKAALRAQRNVESVKLVAVSKYTTTYSIDALLALGHYDFGESRPQQLVERASLLSTSIQWHMIGNLQRNKVQHILPYTKLIHAVDSLKLLERIEHVAQELEVKVNVLLEVNVAGEATKHGFEVDELGTLIPQLGNFQQVQIMGLMTMAPYVEDQELTRPVFRTLRQLRDDFKSQLSPLHPFTELSMGMSNDFEVAIEEGATSIRLGSCLFDGLDQA